VNLGVLRSGIAEQKPESWSRWTEVSGRRQRQIELQCVRQKKHAVNGWTAFEVDKVDRVALVAEPTRPVVEHLSDRHLVGDPEREVQVREPVAAIDGERAYGGSGEDALILLRTSQHVIAESIPLLNGEHEPRS
jgi:hypothetical protein